MKILTKNLIIYVRIYTHSFQHSEEKQNATQLEF